MCIRDSTFGAWRATRVTKACFASMEISMMGQKRMRQHHKRNAAGRSDNAVPAANDSRCTRSDG
eukprot:15295931-Alexandrium_andersonii.AAC.1